LGIDIKDSDIDDSRYIHLKVDLSDNKNIDYITSNILDLKEKYVLFGDDICVYHLAGKTPLKTSSIIFLPKDDEYSSTSGFEYYKHNVCTTINLLNIMEKVDIYKILYASSFEVYSQISDDIDPSTISGNTKYISEMIIKSYVDRYHLEAIIFRICNVAGSINNNPNNIISHFVHNILDGQEWTIYGKKFKTKDGTFVRDYIHLYDVYKAFYDITMNDINYSWEIFNLGSGIGYSVLDILERIKNILVCVYPDYKISRTYFMTRSIRYYAYIVSNIDHTKDTLGWTPSKNIDDMIISTIEATGKFTY
jgi:UDP-glucose 4-epimerase